MDRRIYDNYVIKIAECGSLTRAAAELGITQPALSSGLNHLEKEIGIRIFDRRHIPVRLTPEGEVYYEYLCRVRVLDADFAAKIETMRGEVECTASVGAPNVYVESVLADAVVRLCQSYPDYRFSVHTSPLSELVGQASRGALHCFVSTTRDLPERFETRKIKTETACLCIPKKYSVNDRIRASGSRPGEVFNYGLLDGERFVFLEENLPLRQMTDRFLAQHGVRPVCGVTVDQVSSALQFCLRGEGICFASEQILRSKLDLSTVSVYPLPASAFEREIYLAYDGETFLPAACRELIRILCD